MDSGIHILPSVMATPVMALISIILPEIVVGACAIILLLGGVFLGDRNTRKVHGLGLFMLISLLGVMLAAPPPFFKDIVFSRLFISDGFSYFVKTMLVAGAALAFLLSGGWLARPPNQRPEFPVLMLFSLLGMMLMASANNLLSLYVSLELSSLPLYVLAAMDRDGVKPAEAGLKYFVLGSLASGLLLLGISLVYGFAGSTGFEELGFILRTSHPATGGIILGLVLILVAFAFKISAAPFHMWTPDVYEGAPTPVTAYFAIAPKIAAVALLVRVLMQPFGSMMQDWQQVVVALSVISMIAGALGALTQSNIKRLLAYSSIGHVGYALMGLAAGTAEGIASVLIYFTLYIFMSAGAFACVMLMSRGGEAVEDIASLAGLSRTRPGMAFALSAFMFSMAGIPPLSGFFGKLYVFLAALHAGLFGLAVTGVLASVVACFYYLKIVKIMYFDEPGAAFDHKAPLMAQWALAVCSAVTLFFFLLPAPLVAQARIAAQALLQ